MICLEYVCTTLRNMFVPQTYVWSYKHISGLALVSRLYLTISKHIARSTNIGKIGYVCPNMFVHQKVQTYV